MYISLTSSRTNGFKKWSDNHRPSNDDDQPGGATPIAVAPPLPHGGWDATQEESHPPWLVPGTGTSF